MAIELLASDFENFTHPIDSHSISLDSKISKSTELRFPHGHIQYKEQSLGSGIIILQGHYLMEDDVYISGKGESNLLEIQLNFSREPISYQDKRKTQQVANARSANIAFLNPDDNQARILFQKEVAYDTFDIHIPTTLLDRYQGESKLMDLFISQIHQEKSAKLASNKLAINPAMYSVVQDIKTCGYAGLTRQIYLESKVYELLALLYESTENQAPVNLKPSDQDKIHLAADIIRENLENPFTIFELARLVGINQTKLKTGFKEVFGQTVFGYLQELRMRQARAYLLDKHLSIKEIAERLGYQNTANFSTAFKRTFGLPPVTFRES